MERGVLALALSSGTEHIDPYPLPSDPYQMCQVHDYDGVSFLKMDAGTKAATKRTIAVLSAHYPEMLDQKFFVNVPWVLSWVYTAIKVSERIAAFTSAHVERADGRQEGDRSQIRRARLGARVGTSPRPARGHLDCVWRSREWSCRGPSLD